MARLSIYLPPFSPDYSGVASSFFNLRAITVMHDASGCTGNYCSYDEPRWYGSHAATVCSALREIDAVMGNDKKLVDNLIAASEELRPQMIAIVASPVPMVVGCDTRGIAKEVEHKTGIPSFGFDTTGTRYYDFGVEWASRELIGRFTKPASGREGINLLGADTLDFPLGTDYLVSLLEGEGLKVNAVMPARTLEDVERLSGGALSVVLSLSGLGTARLLEKQYGIPFLTGLPYGRKGEESFLSRVRKALDGEAGEEAVPSGDDVLIAGETVISQSVAAALYLDYGLKSTVASLYSDERGIRRPGDLHVKTELELIKLMRSGRWDYVIADPMVEKLRPQGAFIPLPAHTISSKLNEGFSLFREGFEEHIGCKCRERSLKNEK